MKSIVYLLAVFALVGTFQANGQTLYNGGFEDEGASTDSAAGWGRWGDWINRENMWEPTRDGACLIGYHHWEVSTDNTSGIYQDIHGVETDEQYTFKIYAMADVAQAADEVNAETVELRLESPVDGKQKTIASKKYKFSDISETETGNWSTLRVSGTPLNETLRVVVIIEPGLGEKRGGTIKFDEATLISK